jgi:hypothetical protein
MIRDAFVVPVLLAALLFVALAGCVDIPSTGPTPPDYRAQLRILDQAFTVDTVALLLNKTDITIPSDTFLVYLGTDTARTIKDTIIAYKNYRRMQFNFASQIELLIDKSVYATLSNGGASAYLDLPSGSRKMQVRGSGTYVDSVSVRDTTVVTTTDTLKVGKKTKKEVVGVEYKHTYFYTIPQDPVTTIVDSLQSPTIFGPDVRSTIMLSYDRNSTISHVSDKDSRNGAIRYGLLRYRGYGDRYTFATGGIADTAQIRWANASRNLRNSDGTYISYDVQRQGKDAEVVNVQYSQMSVYAHYPSAGSLTYKFFLYKNQTKSQIDTVTVSTTGGQKMTIVLTDSLDAAGKFVKYLERQYMDE